MERPCKDLNAARGMRSSGPDPCHPSLSSLKDAKIAGEPGNSLHRTLDSFSNLLERIIIRAKCCSDYVASHFRIEALSTPSHRPRSADKTYFPDADKRSAATETRSELAFSKGYSLDRDYLRQPRHWRFLKVRLPARVFFGGSISRKYGIDRFTNFSGDFRIDNQ